MRKIIFILISNVNEMPEMASFQKVFAPDSTGCRKDQCGLQCHLLCVGMAVSGDCKAL